MPRNRLLPSNIRKVGNAKDLFSGAAGVTFGLLQDDVVVAGSGLKKVNDTKQPEETKTTYTDEDGKAKPWREAVPGPVGDLFGRVAGAKGTSLDPATHVESEKGGNLKNLADHEVAEAPWSVAERAVALRFDHPRATVLVLVLG